MHADEHAGAMCMTMTMMRPGLFSPNVKGRGVSRQLPLSLVCPDEAACSVCGVLGMNQCRASLLHKQHKQVVRSARRKGWTAAPARAAAPHALSTSRSVLHTDHLRTAPSYVPSSQRRSTMVATLKKVDETGLGGKGGECDARF